MDRRVYVPVRLSTGGLATIEAMATVAKVSRSEMIRTLLGEAVAARQKKVRR